MHSKVKIILNVLAVGVRQMIGSILVASKTGASVYGFVLFLTSSIASSMLLWNQKEQRSLLVLNLFYIGVNIFGLARWSEIL